MKYDKSYCEEKGISTSRLNEAQRTLYYIAENMKMAESISEEGYKHFNMAIKALEHCWIPVSERLPEKNIAVLTYVSTGPSQTYCLAYWNDVRGGWEEWIGYELIEKDRGYKVLAWMPLPEPYKGVSE